MKKTTSRDVLHALNMLIGFFLFLGIIWFVFTIGISIKLFFAGFIVNFILSLLYEKYMLYGRFRKTVIVLRTVAVVILLLALLAPVMLMKFKNTKLMYPIKRFCYSYGNYGFIDNNILPYGLPEKCDDYLFITKGSVPAQDHHADAYLIFHTDSKTLKEYENHFDSLNDAELKVTHMPDKGNCVDNDDLRLKCPEELPMHVFVQLQPEHIHDFEKAIIYIQYLLIMVKAVCLIMILVLLYSGTDRSI